MGMLFNGLLRIENHGITNSIFYERIIVCILTFNRWWQNITECYYRQRIYLIKFEGWQRIEKLFWKTSKFEWFGKNISSNKPTKTNKNKNEKKVCSTLPLSTEQI